ncbi:MAG: radical SAM protein [Anaerolineales bacterium]
MLKITLFFPPPNNFFQPYTSLPALTAYLRREGYAVTQRDLNIEACEYFLTKKRLIQARKAAVEKLDSFKGEDEENDPEKHILLRVLLSADYVIDHIDEAKKVRHSPVEFYRYDRAVWASNVISLARALISAEYYPAEWGTDYFVMDNTLTIQGLLDAAENRTKNIFLSFFQESTIPSIQADQPDLVGISITYPGQLFSSLTLAYLLKKHCPGIHVCLGGAFISTISANIQQKPDFFRFADSLVVGEGEHALLALAKAIETDGDLSGVPNLMYLQGDEMKVTEPFTEDVNELPCPDYEGLPIQSYLTPMIRVLLPTERGCYWRRCAFCRISSSMGTYRARKIDLVLKDMQQLSSQLGTRVFFLSNDAMPPARMKTLAQAIAQSGLNYLWQTEARLEKNLTPETCRLLYQGGCRRLLLGLESSVQRVSDLMDKGIATDQAGQLVQNCYQAGISTHLFLMVGFPSETRQEAGETLNFFAQNHAVIDTFDYARFVCPEGSKVVRNPERYGVVELEQPNTDTLLNMNGIRFKTVSGMIDAEITQQISDGMRFFERYPEYCSGSHGNNGVSGARVSEGLYLNYLVHFNDQRPKEMLAHFQRSTLPKIKDLLDLIPRPAEGLRHQICDNQVVILFNPHSAESNTFPAEAFTLLTLSKDGNTVGQILNTLTANCETLDLIKRYSRGLNLCKTLIAKGYLQLNEMV